MAQKKQQPPAVQPEMGRRIQAFLTANGIKNHAQFAEGVLGISRQSFHAWLNKDMEAGNIAAKPVLLCAEALGTNAEYLLCMTDDPRPETALTTDEATLVDTYRALSETDRDRLLAIASDWLARGSNGGKTAASPFAQAVPTHRR